MEGGGEEGSKDAAAPTQQPALKKGPWTAEEDAILIEHVRKNGEGHWKSVQRTSGLARCGKSSRLRWANHLRPNLKKGQLTPEEELLVLRLHAQIGNKWARMAAQLPGRTDNEIKNYWNTRVKRRQRAGLPLYPPGIGMQRNRPPPIMIPSTAPSSSAPSPVFGSPMPLFGSPTMQLPEAPRAKRARDDGMMMFQFPISPAASVVPRTWHTAPSTPTGATMFDYGIMPPMTPPPLPPWMYSARMEVNSSHVLDGSGGMELMDKLLLEAERSGGEERESWADAFADFEGKESNAGGEGTFMGSMDLGALNCTTGLEEMNPVTHNDISVSDLFEMIPTVQPALVTPDSWNNSDSSDTSNGGQSVLTNDDLTVDMHQLASSLSVVAPLEPEWNMAPCHWNNMPELV